MLTNKVFWLLPCGLLLAISASGATAQQLTAVNEVPAGEVGPLVSAPAPKRPAEMAPKPPRVSCQGNQLTIFAENSTMRSILTAVQACTGMQIDLPGSGANERTYLQLGPGPTREVMDALLSSTDLDYVIQPSSAAPEKISRILLFVRAEESKDAKGTSLAANVEMRPARRAWMASRNTGRPVAKSSDNEEAQPVEEEAASPATPEIAASKPSNPNPAGATAAEPRESANNAQASGGDKDPGNTVAPIVAGTAAAADAVGTPAPASEPAPAPASSDPAQASPGAKELENKIGDMQHLFEERKKLAAHPENAPDQ